MRLLGAWVLTLILWGCLDTTTFVCEHAQGRAWCGPGTVCTAEGCAFPQDVAACTGLAEGAACVAAGGLAGLCAHDVCRALVCGDGLRSPVEACDDGNTHSGDGCSSNCASTEICGNGQQDPGEACDDGNASEYDACHRDCQVPRCGDGVVDTQYDEVCDDGNQIDGDGCSATCRSSELCGNGVLDRQVGEACDDGNQADGDGCQGNCQLPRCGDGRLDAGEVCDDGNTVDGDGCAARCHSTETCGNNVRDAHEACDDGNQLSGDGCSATCTSSEACGNAVVDPGEACDDGNTDGGDGCAANCRSDEQCGNGVLDGGEQCDEGAANSQAPDATCRLNCQVRHCGDGVRDAFEQCDAGAANVDGVADACRPNCRLPACGDRVVDSAEVCDDGNRVSGDGCANLCNSNEVCGNGVLDVARGEQCDVGVAGLAGDGCSSRCKLETLSIVEVTPTEGTLTAAAAWAWDTTRGRLVLFTGLSTWEYDGVVWRKVTTNVVPTARSESAMAFDAARARMVLFGGVGVGAELNDTWEYDGLQWYPRTPASGSPGGRRAANMVYDPSRGRVVLHGGAWLSLATHGGGLHTMGDTWEWNGSAWTELTGTRPTYPVRGAGLAFDPARNQLVMQGGEYQNGSWQQMDRTYVFDATGWTELSLSTAAPSTGTMGVIPSLGGVVKVSREGVWRLDASTWTKLDIATPPDVAAGNFWTVFDATTPTLRFVDLATGAGYALVGSTWQAQATQSGALHATPGAYVYDPLQRRIVMLTPTGKTWSYDGVWLKLAAVGPSLPDGLALVYRRATGAVRAVGANLSQRASLQAWDFDGANWREIVEANAPVARGGFALAHDASVERTVMHGGWQRTPNLVMADTWSLDASGWHDVSESAGPGPRFAASMQYDLSARRVVLFGGATAVGSAQQAQGPRNDLWELTGDGWQPRAVSGAQPAARSGHAMAYDEVTGAMLVFGGQGSAGALSDLWRFDGAWRLVPEGVLLPSASTTELIATPRALLALTAATVHQVTYGNTEGRELCARSNVDADADGLTGCGHDGAAADPDCWHRCTPLCPPATTASDGMQSLAWPAACAIAYPNAPWCGDGACQPGTEDSAICSVDCPL